MRRVLIIGNCGTGKTKIGRKPSMILKLPLIHLDYYYWRPKWTKPKKKEWRKKVTELVQRDTWIMDGNYRSTLDIRVPEADTIIFLDFPRHIATFRVITRYLRNLGKEREDVGGNNRDKIDLEFIRWVLCYPREEILERLQQHMTNQRFIHLRSSSDIKSFLASIAKNQLEYTILGR